MEIPNVVRTVISSRLIQLYHTFCTETNFKPPKRSTLFNILMVKPCLILWFLHAGDCALSGAKYI